MNALPPTPKDELARMRRALEQIEQALSRVTPGEPGTAYHAIGSIAWSAAYGLRGEAAFDEPVGNAAIAAAEVIGKDMTR